MTTDSAIAPTAPGPTGVVARFPVCLFASVALCVVANLRVAGILVLDPIIEQRVIMGLIAAFLAGGIGHLFAESRGDRRPQNFALALGLAGLAAIAFYLQPVIFTEPLFMLPGLVLLFMVAGYAGPASRLPAFWLFNARLAIAIVVATGVGLLFGAGLWAVIRSYGYLFPPGLESRWEEHAWLTGITLIGPVGGLSLIQARLDDGVDPVGDRSLFGRVVSILAAWILVPIVLIYAVLLHVYAAKVVWQGTLPDGEIGWMVLGFLLAGTATWLIVQPWAEHGNRLLRWFAAGWLKLTIIPVVLLGAAVIQRLWAYGVLPERYGLALVALWMFAVAAYAASIRGRPDPRVAVAGLGFALVVCAVGPWGARGLSVWNQADRFGRLLEQQGVIVNGRIVVGQGDGVELDRAAKRQAVSIVVFLDEVGALGRLEPLFSEDPNRSTGRSNLSASEINSRIGAYWGPGASAPEVLAETIQFRADVPADIAIADGTKIVGPLVSGQTESDRPGGSVRTSPSGLVVAYGAKRWMIDAGRLADGVGSAGRGAGRHGPLVMDIDGAHLIVEEVHGRSGPLPYIHAVRLWLVVPDDLR